MLTKEVEQIVDDLEDDEKVVLEEMPRVPKSKKKNTFHQAELGRRKRCWDIDVKDVLRRLANKGLVYSVGRGRWRTTKVGRIVSHYLFEELMLKRYPFPVRRA